MRWVIGYDISDHGQRRRVARRLEAVGARVQYSVFEADMDTHTRFLLSGELECLLDTETDSIRWYPLCHACQPRTRTLGHSRYLEQGAEYLLF